MAEVKAKSVNDFHPDPALMDPFKSYQVKTYNPKFTGDFADQELVIHKGSGHLDALPADADEDTVAKRRAILEHMQNSRLAQEPVKDADGAIVGYRYYQAFEVTVTGAPAVTEEPKAPTKNAEKVPA